MCRTEVLSGEASRIAGPWIIVLDAHSLAGGTAKATLTTWDRHELIESWSCLRAR